MKLNEDRISNISHKIHDRLYLDEFWDYLDEDEALKITKKTLTDYFMLEEQLDEIVRQKIGTLKRGVYEGTPEWDVMYRKYFEEEKTKRKL